MRGVDLRSSPARSSGSSGRTAPARRRRCGCSPRCSPPTAGTATVVGYDLLADPRACAADRLRRRRAAAPTRRARSPRSSPAGASCTAVRAEARRRTAELCDHLDLRGDRGRAPPGRCRAASAAGSTSPSGWCTGRRWCSWTSRPPGLDPQSRSNLWEHVRRLRGERQTTVFLTTHYLDEADALCDRLLIIDHGAHRRRGLAGRAQAPHLRRRGHARDSRRHRRAARQAIAATRGVRDVAGTGATLRLTVDHGDQALMALVRALDATGVEPRVASPGPPDPRRRLPHRHRPLAARGRRPRRRPELARPAAPRSATSCLIYRRQVRQSLREPMTLVLGLLQPLLYLLLFGAAARACRTRSATGRRPAALRAGHPGAARDVQQRVRRVRHHRGAAARGRRALPRDPGQPAGAAPRPGPARRARCWTPGVVLLLLALALGLRAPPWAR